MSPALRLARWETVPMVAGPPVEPVTLVDAVRRLVNGRPYKIVWRNMLGGLTVRVTDESTHLYVKWVPATTGLDVADELARLAWAAPFTPVPAVVDQGRDAEGSWFVTDAIDAENAVSPTWRRDPATATRALGEGLRALHDALPREDCPFEWSADSRLHLIERRRRAGELDHHEWSVEFAGLTIDAALGELRQIPPEDSVVCHGDACAPNTLIDEHGRWTAHLDLDQLGVGDRWADLAVAAWSTVWNYGPGWEETVYDAYGIEADPLKIRYYRLLWELA
jgi:aminoglycoside phosphotransferase